MNSRWTIMHTESHRQWGGQERRVFNESRWMHDRGHRIVIAAPRSTPLFDHAERQGWETHAVGFTQAGMLKDMLRMRGLLKKVRPHVLNTHGNTDSKVGLAAAWGLNIDCLIRTRHSTPPVGNSWYNRLLYGRLCHHIFTTADCITRQLCSDLDIRDDRISTVPSGIDCPEDLIDHESARQRLAGEIGVAGHCRFIGFVGRLSAEKGLLTLVDAFAGVADRIPDHRLVIVGAGDMDAALDQRARRLSVGDRVHRLGYRDDPWPYFRAFDGHVLASSQFEGVPQTLLQAMFARCPVIGTRVGGIPDIVDHGKTGLLVPPDDPDALAAAILQTLDHPDDTRERVRRAHKFAAGNHTLEAMGNRILRIYGRYLVSF